MKPVAWLLAASRNLFNLGNRARSSKVAPQAETVSPGPSGKKAPLGGLRTQNSTPNLRNRQSSTGLALDDYFTTQTLCKISRGAYWVDNSAEALLKILSSPSGRSVFMDFLASQHSEENLLFWQAVEDAKPSSGQPSAGCALGIIQRFIRPGCECEVNIDDRLRSRLLQLADAQPLDTEALHSELLRAQDKAVHLMATDCLPRFLDSCYFGAWLDGVVDEYEAEALVARRRSSWDSLSGRRFSNGRAGRHYTVWLQRFIHVCDILPFSVCMSELESKAQHHDSFALIYVNKEFTRMTGYAHLECINQNCRFLQGKGTEQAEIDKIRQKLKAREAVSVTITNYRKNGEMFRNFMFLRPVFDSERKTCRHYVGFQFDVTDFSEAKTDALAPILSFLPEKIVV